MTAVGRKGKRERVAELPKLRPNRGTEEGAPPYSDRTTRLDGNHTTLSFIQPTIHGDSGGIRTAEAYASPLCVALSMCPYLSTAEKLHMFQCAFSLQAAWGDPINRVLGLGHRCLERLLL